MPTATEPTAPASVPKAEEPKATPASQPNAPKESDWVAQFVNAPAPKEESDGKSHVVQTVAEGPDKSVEPKPEPAKADPTAEAKPDSKPEKADDKATLEKRLKDNQHWTNKVNQQNVEVGRKLEEALQKIEVLNKKLDGTYEEPQAVDPEVKVTQAITHTKLADSHVAAVEIFKAQGMDDEAAENEVKRLVWNDDAPFQALQKDPSIYARVMNAKLPVVEAVKVVREQETRQKYGSTPESMREKLKQEIREELKTELRQELEAELKGKGVQRERPKPVAGLSEVRGVTKVEATESDQTLSLESLFPSHFQKTAG